MFIRDYHFPSYAELQEPQLRRMWEEQLVDIKAFMPYNYAHKHIGGVVLTCTCERCGGGKKQPQFTWEKHTGFRVEECGNIKWMMLGPEPDNSGTQTYAERLAAAKDASGGAESLVGVQEGCKRCGYVYSSGDVCPYCQAKKSV